MEEPRNRKEWRTRCRYYVPCCGQCARVTPPNARKAKADTIVQDWKCKGQCQRMWLYDRVTYGKEVEFEIE